MALAVCFLSSVIFTIAYPGNATAIAACQIFAAAWIIIGCFFCGKGLHDVRKDKTVKKHEKHLIQSGCVAFIVLFGGAVIFGTLDLFGFNVTTQAPILSRVIAGVDIAVMGYFVISLAVFIIKSFADERAMKKSFKRQTN